MSVAEIVAPATLDTGTVAGQVDASHLTVDLADKEITVLVPGSHAGAIGVGDFVLIAQAGRTAVLIDVISGSAWNWRADVGTRAWYDGATAPTGWLIEDGSPFSGTTYPALQTLMGGTTLRDMRDRSWVGKSGTKSLNSTGGAASVTLAGGNVPPHYHATGFTGALLREAGVAYTSGTVTVATTATPGNNTQTDTGTPTSFSVQNPYRAANSIIKAA